MTEHDGNLPESRIGVRAFLLFWIHAWLGAVDRTWRSLGFNLSSAAKFVVSAAVICIGTLVFFGLEDYRKRVVVVLLTVLGATIWLLIALLGNLLLQPVTGVHPPDKGHVAWRSFRLLLSSLILLVFLVTCSISAGAGTTRLVRDFVNPSSTPSIPPTATITPTRTPSPTASPVPSVTIPPTHTPDYVPRATCTRNGPVPCYYVVQANDTLREVSLAVFGTYEYAGRIADLIRDEKGLNAGLATGQVLRVPDPAFERTLPYLNYYLGYDLCPEDLVNPERPCLYVSEGEPYELLASEFYTGDPEEIVAIIEASNDIEYVPETRNVVPVRAFHPGDIVVLPMWPWN